MLLSIDTCSIMHFALNRAITYMHLSYGWLVLYMHTCTFYLYIFVVSRIKGSNITIFENNGVAVVQIERSEKLDNDVMIYVATVDGTAKG